MSGKLSPTPVTVAPHPSVTAFPPLCCCDELVCSKTFWASEMKNQNSTFVAEMHSVSRYMHSGEKVVV